MGVSMMTASRQNTSRSGLGNETAESDHGGWLPSDWMSKPFQLQVSSKHGVRRAGPACLSVVCPYTDQQQDSAPPS